MYKVVEETGKIENDTSTNSDKNDNGNDNNNGSNSKNQSNSSKQDDNSNVEETICFGDTQLAKQEQRRSISSRGGFARSGAFENRRYI